MKDKPKRKRVRFTEKAFAPYVAGIGQAALAWNDLQEELGRLYAKVTQSDWYIIKKGGEVTVTCMALESWQALKVDRSKREMLSAAIGILHPHDTRRLAKLAPDVTWLVKETNSLEDIRNDAIHAPLRLWHRQEDDGKHVSGVEAARLFANRRARKLAEKDILAEFRWCRDMALVLRDFARDLQESFQLGAISESPPDWQRAWPDKPKLPVRKATKTKNQPRPRARGLINQPRSQPS